MSRPTSTARTPGQVLGAGLAGLLIGLAGGAALGAGIPALGPVLGAVVAGPAMAVVSGWADATRTPASPQPVWIRVLASTLVAATAGWILELILPDWPLAAVGALVGFGAGALGLRFGKLVLGSLVGLLVGAGLEALTEGVGWSVVAAATVMVHRTVASVVYRGQEQVRFLAEEVPSGDVPYVVPLAESTGFVGVDYLERYANRVGGAFAHNPPDIGIVDDFGRLAGPSFDPAEANPLVREFYEHTSRFRLAIEPRWKVWMRLPYLVYRQTVARPLGQANAPFHIEEVQRGVISWIDVVDLDDDGVADLRAWVRAYEESGEPLYVGIYTVVEDQGTAYVRVGFPFPAGSFTATLLPSNYRGDGLLLSSRAGEFAGHYLSAIDVDSGDISVVELASFDEEIEVYIEAGELRTDHRFMLGGVEFMSLQYRITRK